MVTCPHCSAEFNTPTELLGKIVECPECDEDIQLPSPPTTVAIINFGVVFLLVAAYLLFLTYKNTGSSMQIWLGVLTLLGALACAIASGLAIHRVLTCFTNPKERAGFLAETAGFSIGGPVALALFIGVCTWAGLKLQQPSPSRPAPAAAPTHDAASAWTMCQSFVEDRLKAPRTAKWPWGYTNYVTHLGGGRYRIKAYVDSQNSFGALLRTHFTAEVRWTGGSNWRLESLELQEP
jgi:hypothetical protein